MTYTIEWYEACINDLEAEIIYLRRAFQTLRALKPANPKWVEQFANSVLSGTWDAE